MDLWGNHVDGFVVGGAIFLMIIMILVWGNLLYEIAKSLFNVEETLASRKNKGWNAVKTSAVFLGFIIIMQGLTLYMTLNRAAEPLIEEGEIDHWIELYNIEETLEYLDSYSEEEDWYIHRQISNFLGRGLMDTGFLITQLGMFFQSLYRGNRKKRLTDRGLYTEEGKKKLTHIKKYKFHKNRNEKTYELKIYLKNRKILFWQSKEEPKRIILDIAKRDLRTLEDLFRLEDVKKEETA